MSDKFGRVKGTASSEMIREAMIHFKKMPKEDRIDLMVKSKALTPEQAGIAKKRWRELQAEAAAKPSE